MSEHKVYWAKTKDGLEMCDTKAEARRACKKAGGGAVLWSSDNPDSEMTLLEEVK
jgi:hypothetical protein